jgi:hypothetical protein
VVDKIHTRIQFCDKNIFIYAINLFNALLISIRTEKRLKTFLSLCETFLLLLSFFYYNFMVFILCHYVVKHLFICIDKIYFVR